MAAKVSQRSQVATAKPAPASQRGASQKSSTRSAPSASTSKKPSAEQSESSAASTVLTTVQSIITKICNFFVGLFYVLKFIITKPGVAWDLVCTTVHLIQVSREAGLWSWSQLWDMFYMQTIAPMIQAEKAEDDAKKAG